MKKLIPIALYFVLLTTSVRSITYAAPFRIENDAATGCAIAPEGAPSLGCFSQIVVNIVSIALQFLGVVAILFFLFGAFKFVTSGGDSKVIDSGRNMMIYSVIGAAFVISAFLIINVLTGTFPFLPIDIRNFTLYQN